MEIIEKNANSIQQFEQRHGHFLNRNATVVLDDIGTIFGNLVPVDDVPPGADILGSAVLVLQVVCVFPHIQSKDRELDLIRNTLHERIVLVGSACFDSNKNDKRKMIRVL